MDTSGPNSPIYPLTKKHSYSTPRSFMGYPWATTCNCKYLDMAWTCLEPRVILQKLWYDSSTSKKMPEIGMVALIWSISVGFCLASIIHFNLLTTLAIMPLLCCQATQCVHLGPRWPEIAASVTVQTHKPHYFQWWVLCPSCICINIYIYVFGTQISRKITSPSPPNKKKWFMNHLNLQQCQGQIRPSFFLVYIYNTYIYTIHIYIYMTYIYDIWIYCNICIYIYVIYDNISCISPPTTTALGSLRSQTLNWGSQQKYQ